MKKHLFFILILFPILLFSQNVLKGKISYPENNKHIGLEGVSVYWQKTNIGTATIADGYFQIPYKKTYKDLIISYMGFKADTLHIDKPKFINYLLQENESLGEVTVKAKKKSLRSSYFGAHQIENMGEGELLKAACCSLSESFETNPSIDVSFSDAVTGTKQIQMLGLTSPYIQMTQENIPAVRGAAQAYGMSFIPGTWVNSIQITKGAGSVINGFESITGQINTELKKPDKAALFYLNIFGSQNGRMEFNVHSNTTITDKISTGLYAHYNTRTTKFDNNNDGFLDSPLAQQVNIMNRWKFYDGVKGWHSSFMLRYLNDNKQMGEIDFKPEIHKLGTHVWGSEIATKRYDSYFKLGKVNPDIPYQSFGYQAAYSFHQQNSYFGQNIYDITHKSFYTNFIFESILSNTYHKFKTGASITYDEYSEKITLQDFIRTDKTIGGFFEYNFDNDESFSLNTGLRGDYHNHWGFFISPRLHLRYQPFDKTTLRFSGGRGKRTANIFAENQKIFATNRVINISAHQGAAYGLDPETAWNYGLSLMQGFNLFDRKGDTTLDFYRTDFLNQVVVDYETPAQVNFYNLNGVSYANSLQLSANYELLHDLDIRLAYKFYDVKTIYNTHLLENPLQAKNRFFINLAYETHPHKNGAQWLFDYTFNAIGKQRIPYHPIYTTGSTSTYAEAYSLMNMQVTKKFSEHFSIYLGGENLGNYKQENPILGSDLPFSTYFDSSMIYAPVHGRTFYAGLRYKIKKVKKHTKNEEHNHEEE